MCVVPAISPRRRAGVPRGKASTPAFVPETTRRQQLRSRQECSSNPIIQARATAVKKIGMLGALNSLRRDLEHPGKAKRNRQTDCDKQDNPADDTSKTGKTCAIPA